MSKVNAPTHYEQNGLFLWRPFSGDVMKESAQLALSWLRSRSVEVNALSISQRRFLKHWKK